MFRYFLFVFIFALILYFFGNRLVKWIESLAKAVDRKENEKWKKFDKKLNPKK